MIGAFDNMVVLTGSASNKEFIRLPHEVIERVARLEGLARNTSGLRIRFKSDTKKIRIAAKNGQISQYTHLPISSSSGFDIYLNNRFKNNIRPELNKKEMDQTIELQKEGKMNVIDIYFPLYNSVVEFGFEIDPDASIEVTDKPNKPILFYGSSVTQGGCASRPGNSYSNMLSQILDRNTINLGFSGNARGDLPIADYISSLDLDAFVYDYDHNAPDTDWLKETHELFFRNIREKKPDLPVIMMSRHDYDTWPKTAEDNRAVVMTTYLNALKAGDENVYFIDGRSLFGTYARDRCTLDGVHPNDIGFERMAKTLLPVLQEILEER